MILIQCAKTPFLWDLNEPGSSGESDPQNKNSEGVEASKPRRQIEEAEIVKDSARSGANWAGRRSRNKIKHLENQQNKNTSWKWKSFPKSKNTKWNHYDITEAQKAKYRKRKREKYAALNKEEKKALSLRMHDQQKSRFAKLTPKEQKEYVLRRNARERQRKLKKRLTRNKEETLQEKALRTKQNRIAYLKSKARKE